MKPETFRVQRPCRAVDALTGKPCTRLEHPDSDHNASGRRFTTALGPGAVPLRPLDVYAGTRINESEEVQSLTSYMRQAKRAGRVRAKAKASEPSAIELELKARLNEAAP